MNGINVFPHSSQYIGNQERFQRLPVFGWPAFEPRNCFFMPPETTELISTDSWPDSSVCNAWPVIERITATIPQEIEWLFKIYLPAAKLTITTRSWTRVFLRDITTDCDS